MKTHFFSRFILMAGIVFLSHNLTYSQVLEVSSDITPEDMVEILIGSGLEYSNVVYTGNDVSRGQFWGGPGNIGVSNGIILTAGSVNVAPGPNNSGSAGVNSNQPGDADIEMLANTGGSYDACVLEFDFIPYFDYVWFDFVFGSEEYHEYVGQFNDAFGFFISGPGINGPFSNNSANIALIPQTNVPIAINNVNCGNPYNCQQNCTNCQYFVNNTQQFIQYDAFTTVLTAAEIVQPNQTYHIKLAVGDLVDHVYDSGVLLQASSFCSGPYTRIGKPAERDSDDNYRIYPVPAGDVLNIASVDGQHFDIQLSGQDGRTWKSVSDVSSIALDISMVPPGIYILRITGPDGVSTRKICVK